MAIFPKLYITEIQEEDYYPEQKVDFGKLYESSAPLFSRALKIFTLTIDGLEFEAKESLSAFFKENQGGEFLFVEPESKSTFTVKFHEMDSLKFKKRPGKTSSTSITLKEVA